MMMTIMMMMSVNFLSVSNVHMKVKFMEHTGAVLLPHDTSYWNNTLSITQDHLKTFAK